MCGRYALSAEQDDILEAFAISTGYAGPILPADWNITPTRQIYVVRDTPERERELTTLSWGMIAPWAKDAQEALRSQSQAINARIETVHEKPTFRTAFLSRRCLIPASGYYEWATEMGPYSTKQPFYIHAAANRGSDLIAFAGIWDRWRAPDGTFKQSAAIITRPAVGFLATVHHRMPTFLPTDRWSAWLDPTLKRVEEIRGLMDVKDPAQGLEAYPVAPLVNSTANNGARLIAPIELGEPDTLF